MITLSKHAQRRLRGRLGIPDEHMDEIARLAFLEGKEPRELPRKVRHFVNMKWARSGPSAVVRLFLSGVFIFKDGHLITVIKLPKDFRYGDVA